MVVGVGDGRGVAGALVRDPRGIRIAVLPPHPRVVPLQHVVAVPSVPAIRVAQHAVFAPVDDVEERDHGEERGDEEAEPEEQVHSDAHTGVNGALAEDEVSDAEEAPDNGDGERDQTPWQGPGAVPAIAVARWKSVGGAEGPAYAADANDVGKDQSNIQSCFEFPESVGSVELLIVGQVLEVGGSIRSGVHGGCRQRRIWCRSRCGCGRLGWHVGVRGRRIWDRRCVPRWGGCCNLRRLRRGLRF